MKCRRSAASLVLCATVLPLVGCGTSDMSSPSGEPSSSEMSVGDVSSTGPAVQSSVESVVPESSSATATRTLELEGGRVLELPMIAGFDVEAARLTTNVAGIQGSHAVYRNTTTGQSFVVGELRGELVAAQLANPAEHGYQLLKGSDIMGAQIYVKTYGDPTTQDWASVEIAWPISDDEALLVNGQHMTVDELVSIGRQLTVRK